jgi:hypothetical protein
MADAEKYVLGRSFREDIVAVVRVRAGNEDRAREVCCLLCRSPRAIGGIENFELAMATYESAPDFFHSREPERGMVR